jgi:H+-transporting ATPase
MPSRELVPGDLIELKLGDIVPADAMIVDGLPMQVDQSALTGESLPVTIHAGGKLKMGSAIKRGENRAVIVATGRFTFFGKAADMLNSVEVVGRFQKIVFQITVWLMGVSLFLTLIIFIKMMATADTYKVPSQFVSNSDRVRGDSGCVHPYCD